MTRTHLHAPAAEYDFVNGLAAQGRFEGRSRKFAALVATCVTAIAGVLVGQSPASAAPTPVFSSLYLAKIRPATLAPSPESGTEAWLTRTGSKVTTQVSGSGGVVVQLAGQECLGRPRYDVTVDGVSLGIFEAAETKTYQDQAVAADLPAGDHRVEVRFLNDRYLPGRCDRNLIVTGARMQFAAGVIPSADNTGVPDGTPLTVHEGDLTVTRDGTVVDGLDVRGSILVKANNVTANLNPKLA